MSYIKPLLALGVATALTGCFEPTVSIDLQDMSAEAGASADVSVAATSADIISGPQLSEDGTQYIFPAEDYISGIYSPYFGLAAGTSWSLTFSYEIDAGDIEAGEGSLSFSLSNLNNFSVAYGSMGEALLSDTSQVALFGGGIGSGLDYTSEGIESMTESRFVWADYDDVSGLFAVYISATTEKPVEPTASITVDLGGELSLPEDYADEQNAKTHLSISYSNFDDVTEMRLNSDFIFTASPSVLMPEEAPAAE